VEGNPPQGVAGIVHRMVDAPDEDAAIELAIKQFNIRKEDQDRLLVRRYG
jgi:hypothetical protein